VNQKWFNGWQFYILFRTGAGMHPGISIRSRNARCVPNDVISVTYSARFIASFRVSSPENAVWCFFQCPLSSHFFKDNPVTGYFFPHIHIPLWLSSSNMFYKAFPPKV
jgi:hypothetical protein